MKKGERIIILLTTLIIVITLTQITTAEPCGVGTQSVCGVSINTPGHGAVELCNNCFVCGADDGICPSWYSKGAINEDNLTVLLRKGTIDRPAETEYSAAYNTGNEACEHFGGTFLVAETKTYRSDLWEINYSFLGHYNVNNYDMYIRAICGNILTTPSCNECVDPDCTASIKGIAHTGDGNTVKDAVVVIIPQNEIQKANEPLFMRSNTTNEKGEYKISNAYSGKVTMLCSAIGYEGTARNITLLAGENVVDCNLGHASCDEHCTIPSSRFGERICAKECQGENGCDFNSTIAMNACDRRPINFFHQLNSTILSDYIQIEGILCCNTFPHIINRTIFRVNPETEISDLLTRRFRKALPDGTPMDLHIIVYNK
ncbi:carboxypeptidase-like regulatory domain-containing protein [Candidatus Woesearchaeota archaeon]|nr:carboxypeptidase-like regulatory domain-containing protein [Candidatus Woesearchaeota archaeon]